MARLTLARKMAAIVLTVWKKGAHFPEYRTLRTDLRFAAILREMDSPGENEGVGL
jgi:hypothetical protein